MKQNIYLDVDGTIIHEELAKYLEPAAHLREFFVALESYPVYWLTTHCRDGNVTPVLRHLQTLLSADLFQFVLRYKPTVWDINKTEAIDFATPFIWFDNDALRNELEELERHNARHNLIEINLIDNPNQLLEITEHIL